jgi:uncharacterized protein YkwD
MRACRLPVALLTLALALSAAAPAAASPKRAPAPERACESASAVPKKVNGRAIERAMLCFLNAERARYGLRPLRLDRRLSDASRRHAADMARKDYFSHDSLSGASFVDRIRGSGYLRGARRWTVAENIAWGSGTRATPRSIGQAWMYSPGHRANILNPAYRDIGVGIAAGTPSPGLAGATYATDFGARS